MSAMEQLQDAWDEVPDRLRGKSHIPTLAHAVRELVRESDARDQALSDAEGAAVHMAINAEPVDAEYQRGRVGLAEELSAAVGEYQPSDGVWHYVIGFLDAVKGRG